MATVINIQPVTNTMVSTLLPIKTQIVDTTASTINIIATAYYDDGGTDVQIGGTYRCAPNLDFPDYFVFDPSEIFNTLTKYTLKDYLPTIGGLVGSIQATAFNWGDVANWRVRVKFQREFINAQGLVEIDPTPYYSNYFYVHEGCPNREWLTTMVTAQGSGYSTFASFTANYSINHNSKRYLTNYPITPNFDRSRSEVTIRRNESYMLSAFFPPINPSLSYKVEFRTFGDTGNTLNIHEVNISGATDRNMTSFMCGMRDIINGLTANANEGSEFINVAQYRVRVLAQSSNTAPPLYQSSLTDYFFTVDKKCAGKGYMRFAFKNMLGGYDLISSTGAVQRKVKNKFSDFEKSTGYSAWNQPMEFGDINWANENFEMFTVTTQPLREEYAEHFAEMFSSVDVYLREENNAFKTINFPDQSINQIEQPFLFYPIKIKGATIEKWKSTNNFVKLKFSFERSINQRNPRF